MNNKGSMMVGLVLLLTAVIGVVIVDQVAVATYTPTDVVNESLGTVYNGTSVTLANRCVTAQPTGVYDWTNATAVAADQYLFEPQEWPHKQAQVITFATGGFIHNGTVIGLNYSHGCEYVSSSTARLVLQNYAILVAIGLLVLAGGWLYLKGGF